MLTTTPSLVGMDVSDAKDVAGYLRSELGLSGKGQLASALAGCPPMLMYHTWNNLRMKVRGAHAEGEGGDSRIGSGTDCFSLDAAVVPEPPLCLVVDWDGDDDMAV